MILLGLGRQWQGGSRDTAFGRTETVLAGEIPWTLDSGVAPRFPPQSKTRFTVRTPPGDIPRPQHFGKLHKYLVAVSQFVRYDMRALVELGIPEWLMAAHGHKYSSLNLARSI
jgi:hypothetical protein